MLTVLAVILILVFVCFSVCYQIVKAEAHARYMGIKNVSSEKVTQVVRGVEMNAKNIFEEVEHHLDTPDNVIAALQSKVNLNPDVRGYFAAFELGYFPEQGTWFEPYIYQPDIRGFEYRQVGSARHNYTKSPWYVRAKASRAAFWSDPYYYYDGTSMSGHYCTFVKPVYNEKGKLACVCGADMKFEWLAKELDRVDAISRDNHMLNKYHLLTDFDFYTVILNIDGSCIAHPENKTLNITDEGVLKDLSLKKSGLVDMDVDGTLCTVYYGPIEFVDWAVAVIVPKQDVMKPLIPVGIVLLSIGLVGVLLVWLVCRKLKIDN
jgi:hypothetical protein